MEATQTPIEQDLRDLHRRFQDAGYYARPAARVLIEWAALLALGVGCLAPFALGWHWSLRIVGLVASTCGLLGVATIAHTASHGTLSRSRWINDLVLFVSYPFVLMLSATYWHHSHIVVHHPAPNVVGRDDDCDLRPFAANERHAAGRSWPRRLMNRAQGALFPVAVILNAFNIQRQAWTFLVSALARRPSAGRAWVDLACMSLHVALWIVAPTLWFDVRDVAAVYALRAVLLGCGLFAILAPGHYPAAARCLDERALHQSDFELRQTATTVDFRTGWLGRLLCSGLELQIEHHLFPGISHVHLPAMAPAVRAFCARRGLPYRTLPWGVALWESWRVFFHPKPVHASVEALRENAGPPGQALTDA